MQGCPCRVSNNPNPFLSLRRGFNHSPTLANLWQGLKKKATEDPGFLYVLVSRDDAMIFLCSRAAIV